MSKTHTPSYRPAGITSARTLIAAATVATFAHAAQAQCLRFGDRVDYPQIASGFSAADIDGDKDVDILIAIGFTGGDLRVLRNNGAGVFTNELLYDGTGGGTRGPAAGDVNGDGFVDLVFGETDFGLRVMLNNGDYTFAAPTTYGTVPGTVKLADLDGDGDLDAYAPMNMAAVWINDGTGAFADPVQYQSMGQDSILDVVAADFNGDGKLDLLGTNFGGSDDDGDAVQMLLNNGDGTFGKPMGLSPGLSATHAATAADLDGDGDMDVAYRGQGSTERVQVLFNNGDATFVDGGWTATTWTVRHIAPADFDGDGDADLAIGQGAMSASAMFRVLTNDGAGGLISLPHVAVNPIAIGILTADFNGDGMPDVAHLTYRFFPFPENGYVSIFLNETGSPLTDANGDGVVNSTDVSEFINLWFESLAQGTLEGDFDGNGVVNSTDVSAFINVWFAELGGMCG